MNSVTDKPAKSLQDTYPGKSLADITDLQNEHELKGTLAAFERAPDRPKTLQQTYPGKSLADITDLQNEHEQDKFGEALQESLEKKNQNQ
jgi:hypothetical protein